MKIKIILLSALYIMFSGFTAQAGEQQKIAEAYGIKHFSRVKSIQYTFNVLINGTTTSRTWKWFPKEGRVVFENKDYLRQEVTSDMRAVDAKFINDNYWLLFPFHIVWDTGIKTVSSASKVPCPISGVPANHLIIQYLDNSGYTPLDVYELFYDDNYLIREWIYRKAGAKEPTRIATWENNIQLSNITVSTLHVSKDGRFKVWFTDIKIETD